MTSNVVKFPKKYIKPPDNATRTKTPGEMKEPAKYHDEVFEYQDGSYVILVQKKKEKFTVERMLFMAERLKMQLFDALPEYDDLELELEPGPDIPS